MKLLRAVIAAVIASSAAQADVLISQYYEGSSNNKYIELHNPTAAAITMTGYRLTLWTNAAAENWKSDGASPSQSYDLSAVTLQAGDYYLFAHTLATVPAYAGSSANVRSSSIINFNGNDSVVLYKNDTYSTANILDAAGFTETGMEGQDKSFHRISNEAGYDLTAGSNITGFPSVWEQKALTDVDSAMPGDLWYLKAQVASVPPSLDGFTIAADAVTTTVAGVTLSFVASGTAPTEFLASEDAGFAGATWQPYAAVPKFTLSGGPGVKTVHFKLRNAGGESAALSDTIELTSYSYPGTVVITQYYEGLSNNKHIELANLSPAPVDLAGWNLARWTNQDAENWKFTGAQTVSPSQSIPLSGVNTDGQGSTILAPGSVIVISNSQASGPAGAAAPALASTNLSHNGNDSLALYSGSVDPANLADVVSFTDAGNEGPDRAFVRLSASQGFDFAGGSNVTDFPGVWQEVDLSTADAALPGQREHLGTYPGGGSAGYDAWAALYGLTGTAASDDDGDGAGNLIEYATGTVPNNAGSFPVALLTPIGATLTVSWTKGGEAAADPALTWSVEASTSMADGTWSTSGVLNLDNGPTTISADYPFDSGMPKVFLRLKVVRTP